MSENGSPDAPLTADTGVGDAQREVLRLLALMKPMRARGFEKIRVGASDDGGYVMIDDFRPDMPCYSIGVGGDVSWDWDLANLGLSIFQYDHTVAGPPLSHPNFTFHKFGISDDPDWSDDLKGLEEILHDNGHAESTEIILKIDIEGAEWNILDRLPEHFLGRFRQIVCEFHWLDNLIHADFRERALRVFEALAASHGVVHIHANNFAPLGIVEGVPIAGVIEVTFAARSRYDLIESLEIFPTPLDKANNPQRPDIFLGDFRVEAGPARRAEVAMQQQHPHASKSIAIGDDALPALADRLMPIITERLLTTPRIFGDPARLTLGPGCNLVNTLFNLVSGSVSVGAYAFFGHDVRILTGTHDMSVHGLDRQLAVPTNGRDIVIEDGAWISSGATVIGPARIGANAVIGVGSVVIGDVEPGWLYAGVPARKIKPVDGTTRQSAELSLLS
ncbi:hypothetical protein PQ455_06405 [Sphingomonas naphthae]|uniref:Uncharacterized protein n=1 Tax=Sphingomonas naphthae TaxID=1813468 RepID=A0ABY7TQ87_9SPHN|nr:hypothetical protein [Sphingomonas naphthae]WCT74846.1 hypothetical protein PQ455_06405 [Sphingomonas naphthae]